MTSFHTDEYVQFLSRVTPETAAKLSFNGTRCRSPLCLAVQFMFTFLVLVGDDNPPFEGVFEFSSISAGGSIGAFTPNCQSDIFSQRHKLPRSE